MPPKCYICGFYDPKRMSLFRIPSRNDDYCERASLWLKLVNEKPENVDSIRFCSIHFLKSNFYIFLSLNTHRSNDYIFQFTTSNSNSSNYKLHLTKLYTTFLNIRIYISP